MLCRGDAGTQLAAVASCKPRGILGVAAPSLLGSKRGQREHKCLLENLRFLI